MDENDNTKNTAIKNDYHKHNFVGKLFWGLLFILIGVLLFLSNFNIVTIHFNTIWKFWPIVIVMIGLSILSVKNIFGKVIIALVAILSVVAIGYALVYGNLPIGNISSEYSKKVIYKSSSDINKASIEIDSGANSLNVDSSGDQKTIAVAKLKSSSAILEMNTSSVSDNEQSITIATNNFERWWLGQSTNSMDVSINKNIPINLVLNTGASDNNIDLSQVTISQMSVNAGASNFNIKLGSKSKKTSVNIKAGVSSISIKVPENSGISMRCKDGLSSTSLSGFVNKGDGYFQTNNYSTASHIIDIISETGMSSINILKSA